MPGLPDEAPCRAKMPLILAAIAGITMIGCRHNAPHDARRARHFDAGGSDDTALSNAATKRTPRRRCH